MSQQINPRVAMCSGYALPVCETYVWKLDMIENQYPCSPEVFIAAQIEDPLWQYPTADDTYQQLVISMAAYTGTDEANIVMTNGSDNALRLIIHAFAKDTRPVLVLDPTYPHFVHFAAIMADVVHLEVREPHPEAIQTIHQACTKHNPSLCYLVTPNLPLGYIFRRADMLALVSTFPNTIFIVDEAYVEFTQEEHMSESMAPEVRQYENLIVTRTFSKFFGLAALRLGAVVAHATVATHIRKLANGKDITARAVRVGLACLRSIDHYRAQLPVYRSTMKLIAETIRAQAATNPDAIIYDVICRSGLYYTLLCRNPAYVVAMFAARGIIVRDKSAAVPDAVRVCFASRASALAVLAACCEFQQPRTTWDLQRVVRDCRTLCLDLDGTLRPDSQWCDPQPMDVQILQGWKKTRKFICTNNVIHDPAAIEAAYGLKVYTPLDNFSAICPVDVQLHLVGPEHCRAKLRQQGFSVLTVADPTIPVGAIVFCSCFYMDVTDWLMVSNNPEARLLAVEDSRTVVDHMCSEIKTRPTNRILPDLGLVVEFCRVELQRPVHIFGKPSKHMVPVDNNGLLVVVGDSPTDLELAAALGCPVILVDPTRDQHFDPVFQCPVMSSVEKIFALANQ
jgi:histidinol-phosphate aminotransferase